MVSMTILAVAAMATAAPAPGIYTNEEDRYFAQEAARADVPDWLGIEIGEDGRWRRVDAFGKPQGEWAGGLPPGARPLAEDRITVAAGQGRTTELRRGQAFRCWVSLRREKPGPDGGPDWSFAGGLAIHDQGGRALATDADAAPEASGVVLRLRQVVWPPPSRNKPSLVLYVHRPDTPDRAVSYAWADPQARLIGINLRWMQGSCSKEGEQT